MVRPITVRESYVGKTGESMNAERLVVSHSGCRRKSRFHSLTHEKTNKWLVLTPDFNIYHLPMKKVHRLVCGLLSASFAFSVLAYGSATNELFINAFPQTRHSTSDSVGVAKPGVNPAAGTWKSKATTVQPDGTHTSASSTTVKDNGDSWTATTT